MDPLVRESSVDFDSYLNLDQNFEPASVSTELAPPTSASSLSFRSTYSHSPSEAQYQDPNPPYLSGDGHDGLRASEYAAMPPSAGGTSPLNPIDSEMNIDYLSELTGYEKRYPHSPSQLTEPFAFSPIGMDIDESSRYTNCPHHPLVPPAGRIDRSRSNSHTSQNTGSQASHSDFGSHSTDNYFPSRLETSGTVHTLQAPVQPASLHHPSRSRTIPQVRVTEHDRSERPSISQKAEDPAVQARISRLLADMRKNSHGESIEVGDDSLSPTRTSRLRKEEEDMDRDERLLASEEGKKLSSKERRQLRNKVSARAFRSRRKEYITQLEQEVSARTNEVDAVRAEKIRLKNENKQLADLTRKLLSQPAFSGVLEALAAESNDGAGSPPTNAADVSPNLVKDVNPSQYQARSAADDDVSQQSGTSVAGYYSRIQERHLKREGADQPSSWSVTSQVF